MLRAECLGFLVVLLLSGCSENFGPAPLGGIGLRPTSERAIGPIVPRAGIALGRTTNGVLVATDRGMYRVVDGTMPRWLPEHPGFVTPEGDASPQFLQKLASAPESGLFLHNVAVGGGQRDHFLMSSPNGGKRYRHAGRPNPLERSIDQIAVCGPGGFFAQGAYLATQGLQIFTQEVGATEWTEFVPPSSLSTIEAAGGADGRFVLAVQGAGGGELWRSSTDSLFFERIPSVDASPWLATTLDAEGRVLAMGERTLVRGNESWTLPAGWLARGASFSRVLGTERYAILAEAAAVGQRLFVGSVGDDFDAGSEPSHTVLPVAPVYDGVTAWLLTPTADLLRFRAGGFVCFPFAGHDLWWTALSDDPRVNGRMALGNRLTGRVHVGSQGGPWTDIRARLLSSTARHIAFVPGTADGFWLGSFGLYEFTGALAGGSWQTRTAGMSTYLQTGTLDLMEMSTLYHDPTDASLVWSGTTEGNGPYVSFNKGLSWTRRHAGLGDPGTIGNEDGLPNATQIRAFAIDAGRTWMASFRGGVWLLSGADVWEQRNEGLPDRDGVLVEGCCFGLLERHVDIRDLAVNEGSLLAATAWGVYRDDSATGVWEPSLDGLSNGDITALAVHPSEPDWILAAARGKFDVPDWLFLSVDGGRSWRPVESGLEGARALDVIWSNSQRNEAVAILDGLGAWWMELNP